MSDVNVIITAVDKGMDIIDGYEREVEDLRAHIVFDIHSVIAAVEREKSFVEQKMDDLCYSSYEDTAPGEKNWNQSGEVSADKLLILPRTVKD